ncbi:thermonuclease family protein [Lacisediminimonas profundi]|uniref:thermonuclease family protein n=1 Tax=Lacisediminimonas profundi TaxID=2603856 RepID=UPI001F501CD3|nr:thermonuclease family protein [Lacisediminimonas profundi]
MTAIASRTDAVASGATGRFSRFLIIFFIAAAASFQLLPAYAARFEGKVVGLSDGDTITVLSRDQVQYKIRLAGIDAPEKRQAYGDKSRAHLASLVFGKWVAVDWTKRDRYGRILGKVSVAGQDVCLEQIRNGMAWHYKKYAADQDWSDRSLYAAAERDAVRDRRGLWGDAAPVPPWGFRSNGRHPT